MTAISLATSAAPFMEQVHNPETDAAEAVRRVEAAKEAARAADEARAKANEAKAEFYAALDGAAASAFDAGNAIASLAASIPHYVPTIAADDYDAEKKNWRFAFVARSLVAQAQAAEARAALAEGRAAGNVAIDLAAARATFDAGDAKGWPQAMRDADGSARSKISQAFALANWSAKEGRALTAKEIEEKAAARAKRGKGTKPEADRPTLDAILKAGLSAADLVGLLAHLSPVDLGEVLVETMAKYIASNGQCSGSTKGLHMEVRNEMEVIAEAAAEIVTFERAKAAKDSHATEGKAQEQISA